MRHTLYSSSILIFVLLFLLFGCNTSNDESTENASYSDLRDYQWHLVNTGQSAFSSSTGTPGEDINQSVTYTEGITGQGVIIAVLDEGLEIDHIDLDDNILPGESWDFYNDDNNPTNPSLDGDHGTSVAGLIAAENNTIGGRGVAPLAKLKGFNMLKSTSNADFIASLGFENANPHSYNVDIFNMSFGWDNNYDFSIDPFVEIALQEGVNSLRNGKGALYLKAAGNGFSDVSTMICSKAEINGLSCQNPSMDPENATPWTINVGSLNADGIKASYSSAGSAIWISAPGGEYGVNYPAMITTDQSGCNHGYDRIKSAYNAFESNSNGLNYQCDFTSTFNGTSSATPVTAGAIALMLEVNPALTWRDVKHILATTARQVDSSDAPVWIDIGGSSYMAKAAWITNSAGFSFHNYYGFGAVDVDAATTMANGYNSTFGILQTIEASSDTLPKVIPDDQKDGTTDVININSNISVEAVQVVISITHPNCGNLGIELTSPNGTTSILFNVFNGFEGTSDLDEMVLLSNAFYSEDSSGDWALRVIDAESGSQGSLTAWTLKIYGH